MSEYVGPIQEKYRYDAKFLRMGERIYTTEPNDVSTQHRNLAILHGILGELEALRLSDPESVDGGFYGVENEDHEIVLIGNSSSLKLPATSEARTATVLIFQKLSPGYSVANNE